MTVVVALCEIEKIPAMMMIVARTAAADGRDDNDVCDCDVNNNGDGRW